MAADRHEFFGGVSRKDRDTFYGGIVPDRIEGLSWAVNDILSSLAISMPELTYAPQAQSVPTVLNAPKAESWLAAAATRGSDGASAVSGSGEAYPMSAIDPRWQPVESGNAPATGNTEALRAATGMSAAEERVMESNAAATADRADTVTQAQPMVAQPLGSLEDDARRLINEAFGPQENQREFA